MPVPKQDKCNTGFSLVELLVVLAVLGVLVAILFPVVGKVQERGRQATCQNNIEQMNLALRQYVSDNDSTYTNFDNWQEALQPYLENTAIFECPTEGNPANSSGTGINNDYSFNGEFLNVYDSTRELRGINETSHNKLNISKLWTFSDSASDGITCVTASCGDITFTTRHSSGGNTGFADGHVKWLTPQGFADVYCFMRSSSS